MKYLLIVWLLLTYMSDVALIGPIMYWGGYVLGVMLALHLIYARSQSIYKWMILVFSMTIVIIGTSNAVFAGVGGVGSYLIQIAAFILMGSLLFSAGRGSYYIPSERSVIVLFWIEALLAVTLSLLGFSFFDYNRGAALLEYRDVRVMTAFHDGGLNLYVLYIVGILLLVEKYKGFVARSFLIVSVAYLVYALGSRAAILGYLIVVALLPFRNGRTITSIFFLGILASPFVIGLFLTQLEDIGSELIFLSSDSRLSAWVYAKNAFLQSFSYVLFGTGELHQTYDAGDISHGLHNAYYEIAYRFGFILYTVICILFFMAYRKIENGVSRLAVIGVMTIMLLNGSVYSFGSFFFASLVVIFYAAGVKNVVPKR